MAINNEDIVEVRALDAAVEIAVRAMEKVLGKNVSASIGDKAVTRNDLRTIITGKVTKHVKKESL